MRGCRSCRMPCKHPPGHGASLGEGPESVMTIDLAAGKLSWDRRHDEIAPCRAYSVLEGSKSALATLLDLTRAQLPQECLRLIESIIVTVEDFSAPVFPCPLKQTEAIVALKTVEASVAACIADEVFGRQRRKVEVNINRASLFLFSTYLCTINGLGKFDPMVKKHLKDTDLLQAQSHIYRRLAANLYETKLRGSYYHIHGSLEASTTLNMLGLPSHRPDMTDYRQCIDFIESRVSQFTSNELETMNVSKRQAGVACMRWNEFQNTPHGRALKHEPPWRLEKLESESPPVPFPGTPSRHSAPRQILNGIKVLELCRIIAGPAIGRGLAEYGADVIKVTSPNLSDVPYFQVDGNLGKHTVDLDLRSSEGREVFEELLQTADVILDGYRPGSLERLGYGPRQVMELTQRRGRGIVYISENCFGHVGEWSGRPGWQQIADCVTGLAWLQGLSMGLHEPVIPPFPMSDYGTGCMGTIAALTGLYRRAKFGGSYLGTTSLCQYDLFLLKLGLYPDEMVKSFKDTHDADFFKLRHSDSVDEVGQRALRSIRRLHPELFDDRHFQSAYSAGFSGHVRFVKPAVTIEGTWNGWRRASRPNGSDKPTWEDWEVDEEMCTT